MRSFITFICVLLSSNVYSHQFVTKSKILKQNNIKIFVGENQTDVVVLHKNDIVNYDDKIFLLTSGGPYSLKGKMVKKNLLKECGDPTPGIGFKKEGQNGFLIATGEKVKDIVQWYPSEAVKGPKNIPCIKNFLNEQKAEISYFSSKPLNGIIYQVRWRRNLTDEDKKKWCKELAEWNSKIDKRKSFKEIYLQCLRNRWYCQYEDRKLVGFINTKGQCVEIANGTIDCDGKAGIGENLYEFLGVLKLKDKDQDETWLLWNAPGYEGDGIYALEIQDIGKDIKISEEWLVYNGC